MHKRNITQLKNRILFLSLFFICAGSGMIHLGWASTAPDQSLYADLLKKNVSNGRVNYAGFKSAEAELDRYLAILEKTDSTKLSRDEQFAFYTNAYNAWTIKLILSGYPQIKSIKDLGGFLQSPWKKKLVRIDSDILTLDDVEHNILRPRFKDPRVHFAINCAAKSCPPLRSEPYRGAVLDRQLNDSTSSFLNNPSNYELSGNDFYVSRIFKWFSEDFSEGILGFYLKFAQGDLKSYLEANKHKIKIKFMPYDWSLNGH